MHVTIASTGGIKTRTETLAQYYNEIRKVEPLSRQELNEIYTKYKEETNSRKKEHYKNKIISANLPFVVSVAKRYAHEGNLMDIIQEGNIGLLRALEHYDPNKQTNFITYAVNYIVREINIFKSRKEPTIRRTNSGKTYHILSKAKEALFKKLDREPSSDELMEFINETYEFYQIKNPSDLCEVHYTHIDDTPTNGDDSFQNMGGINAYNNASASTNYAVNAIEHEYNSFLTDSLLNKLKPKEKEVIKLLFGIGELREYDTQEIADKLGYTTERIRQLKVNAFKTLRELFGKKQTL